MRTAYVDGKVHTMGLKTFWSAAQAWHLWKLTLASSHSTCFRYLDEQSFRYNNRATLDNPMGDFGPFQDGNVSDRGESASLGINSPAAGRRRNVH